MQIVAYFFTATRKTSLTASKPGMNDVDVYGNIICRVSAPELVDGGYIVPPKVYAHKSKTADECGGCSYERDKHLGRTLLPISIVQSTLHIHLSEEYQCDVNIHYNHTGTIYTTVSNY
jgi:hypothetical protein